MFNRRRNRIPWLAVVDGLPGLLLPAAMLADALNHKVTVDTTAVHNTPGFLDFDFAPGSSSQAAFVQIGAFSPGGSLMDVPQVSGGVSGALPGMLTVDNSTAFTDYFQAFSYGDTLSFLVSFVGPAIQTPNGTATSGSTFGFGMFDATGSIPPLTTDPNGNAFTVDVNLDGSTTVEDFSAQVQVAAVQDAPEPAVAYLLVSVLAGMFAAQRLANRQKQST